MSVKYLLARRVPPRLRLSVGPRLRAEVGRDNRTSHSAWIEVLENIVLRNVGADRRATHPQGLGGILRQVK